MLERERYPTFVSVGRSMQTDATAAVTDALREIDLVNTRFLLAFVPSRIDVVDTAAALEHQTTGTPVFGCTTAGQISLEGYEADALVLLAFPKEYFRCASVLFAPLDGHSETTIAAHARRRTETFQHTAGWNRLGLIFSDGLSKQEDILISTLETVIDGIPIFGGSAGDGLRFQETFVLHGGLTHKNAAVLLLIETNLEFQGLGFDHFLPIGGQIIITAANPDERLVYEINGAPAALEYARLVGCPVDTLSPQVFAENPMLVEHNSNHYVRAISDASDGHALAFMAAIDDGLIMTLGEGQEIIETLEKGLDVKDSKGRAPDFILGFDCVLRKLEIESKQMHRQVSEILVDRRVLGFNTYGEQQAGVHMNQTFVGIAFFAPDMRTAFG